MKSLFFFILFTSVNLFGQISPGELFSGHSNLEGIQNCTKCHDVGKLILVEKCLDCHKEILAKIKNKLGYHFKVSNQNCIECHSDHHGKDFKIIKFDKKKFEHEKTEFALDGKHKNIDCEKCHTKEKITDPEILKFSKARINKTYLGLPVNCINCHKDIHNGSLSENCQSCHNSEKWKMAKNFSHDNSKFKLIGLHKNVDCEKCHPKFGKSLKFVNIKHENCKDCHKDFHKGKFKESCETCHSESSWSDLKNEKKFNHSLTRYQLLGKHINVDCDKCHKTKGKNEFVLPKFTNCKDCHEDFHDGDFKTKKHKGECSNCHEVKGFKPSTFSFVNHLESRFQILGSHIAILCSDCHKKTIKNKIEKVQIYWDEKLNCVSCHEDVHKGKFTSTKISCESCHSSINWSKLNFNHANTKFALRGKHDKIKCEKCHKVDEKVKFSFDRFDCESCHSDIHEKQFEDKNKTLCDKCHRENNWKDLIFVHNRDSKYILDGKHENVSCEKCHYKINIFEKSIVKYRGISSSCQSCHSEQK